MSRETVNTVIHIPSWATHLISDYSDWDRNPQPLAGIAGDTLTLSLPRDAYFEYAFLDAEGNQRPDPNNDTIAESLWHYPQARVLSMPDYRPDVYAPLAKSLEVKEIEAKPKRARLDSEIMQDTYRLILYTPKGYDTNEKPLPVIYVQDGVSYYRHARLASVLELLLDKDLIRPAHIVFIEPNDRETEYSYNRDYQRAVVEEIVPYCDKMLATTNERMAMGASLGGLASALLAWHYPEMFSTVISQSGAFLGTPEQPDPYHARASWMLDVLESEPVKPLRWYLESGSLEWLYLINRAMHQLLLNRGYDHQYQMRHAGHNWVNWRNGLADALCYALSKGSAPHDG